MALRHYFLIVLVAAAWAPPGWSVPDEPSCGVTVDDAISAARKSADHVSKDRCLTAAIDRLAAHVDALRTGKEAFGTIKADAYLHGTAKP